MTATTKEAVEAALLLLSEMVTVGTPLPEKAIAEILHTIRALMAERDAAMAGSLRIKPMEWTQVATFGPGKVFDAVSAGHVYRITQQTDGMCCLTDPQCSSPSHLCLEGAQKAAEALSKARILSAIEPDTERLDHLLHMTGDCPDMYMGQCDGWGDGFQCGIRAAIAALQGDRA